MNQIIVAAWLICQVHQTHAITDAANHETIGDAWEAGYEQCQVVEPEAWLLLRQETLAAVAARKAADAAKLDEALRLLKSGTPST